MSAAELRIRYAALLASTMFEPELKHNLEEFKRWRRKQLKALAMALVASVPVAFVANEDNAGFLIVVYLSTIAIAVGYFEVRLFQVFRRDLDERGIGRS